MRVSTTRLTLASAGIAILAMLLGPLAGVAAASPQVIMSGNPRSGGTVVVVGTGFPPHAQDPVGVQILECSDPGGTVANLPTSAANCEGSTVSPLPINTDAAGGFHAQYQVEQLSVKHVSSINCDVHHYCVVWVGVDYNGAFLSGPHAFSSAFRVGGPALVASSSSGPGPLVVAIPVAIVVVAVVGGVILFRRRRIRHSAVT